MFIKVKQLEIFLQLNFQDFSGWLKKRLKEENDRKNQKSFLGGWPNLAFKVKLELFEFIIFYY